MLSLLSCKCALLPGKPQLPIVSGYQAHFGGTLQFSILTPKKGTSSFAAKMTLKVP